MASNLPGGNISLLKRSFNPENDIICAGSLLQETKNDDKSGSRSKSPLPPSSNVKKSSRKESSTIDSNQSSTTIDAPTPPTTNTGPESNSNSTLSTTLPASTSPSTAPAPASSTATTNPQSPKSTPASKEHPTWPSKRDVEEAEEVAKKQSVMPTTKCTVLMRTEKSFEKLI